ncbi:MAG: hypothetical protein S4CHLAM102_03200 [Chlamydiia bacterium]|nr:hypothetical protein [Chlamydiia bacterium]
MSRSHHLTINPTHILGQFDGSGSSRSFLFFLVSFENLLSSIQVGVSHASCCIDLLAKPCISHFLIGADCLWQDAPPLTEWEVEISGLVEVDELVGELGAFVDAGEGGAEVAAVADGHFLEGVVLVEEGFPVDGGLEVGVGCF